MIITQQSDRFFFSAERQYRKVYQGTLYTLNWTDSDGKDHEANSRNFHNLMRFANNGFSTNTGWGRGIQGITIVK